MIAPRGACHNTIIIRELSYREVQGLVAAQVAAAEGNGDATGMTLAAIRAAVTLPDGVTALEDLPLSEVREIIQVVGEMHDFFPATAPSPGEISSG